ncbi:MAG: DNA topoisomerase (ATP-hydrolyzing) [Clostridia bacterium]
MAKKNDNSQARLIDKLVQKPMDDVMHDSMLPYAEHVILERALPRVEDGLKPVQRRILYAMSELGLTPDKPYRKCARIVGDCLGKYHPHGDSSVYEALVRMAQDFNMGAMLVDGHGNFGSIDGDSAAAMRYTEARMRDLAIELLRDIEKDTVDFVLNFDDSLKEPAVLPGRFPNLLVNGASGIAVGLATNIPPHNIKETINACVAVMDKPDIGLDEIMKIIPCPDFPTGAYILSSSEIRQSYETGKGRVYMRAKTHFEPQKNGKTFIVITELPFQVNKARTLEKILALSQEKKAIFSGVADIRDESDREGMRAVIEIKKDADPEKILQCFYKYSDLQCTFGVNMVAIANGKPRLMPLIDILKAYIKFQEEVVAKRTRFDLDKANQRAHILDGLVIALLNIDEVIKLIRASKNPKIARDGLIKRFALSELQAQAILDLRLQRLTNLEQIAIEREQKDLKKLIEELSAILKSEDNLKQVIKTELLEIRDKYSISRRTKIINANAIIDIPEENEKFIEDATLIFYRNARLKRLPTKLLEKETFADDPPEYILKTNTGKRIRIFTNRGNCIMLPVEDIAEQKPNTKSVALTSLVPIDAGEKVVSLFIENESESENYFFYTKNGNVKSTAISEYQSRTKKLAAINIKDDDVLLGVEPMRKNTTIVLVSASGYAIRFEPECIPVMGRVSGGVKCMKLDTGDSVIFASQIEDEGEIFVMSDKGYAKRSLVFDYEIQGRNGKGLKTFDFRRNGSNGSRLVTAYYVKDSFELKIFQLHGTVSQIDMECVKIARRADIGQMLAMCVLDDVVTNVEKTEPIILE